jgi:molybdopterin synthase catalytic subunit
MDLYRVVSDPIDVGQALSAISDPACGGQALFLGTVRNQFMGRVSNGLTYDAYVPLAEKELARIGAELRQRFDIRHVAIIHRMGWLAVGEVAVVVAVSSPHRHDAIEAARIGIDEVKRRVPIWKQEHFADGLAAWHHDPEHFAPGEG